MHIDSFEKAMRAAVTKRLVIPIHQVAKLLSWDAYSPTFVWIGTISEESDVSKILFGVAEWIR